jgi:hypothetical protein
MGLFQSKPSPQNSAFLRLPAEIRQEILIEAISPSAINQQNVENWINTAHAFLPSYQDLRIRMQTLYSMVRVCKTLRNDVKGFVARTIKERAEIMEAVIADDDTEMGSFFG